ncbi:SapC family protein [Catenovulum agarivorans DS-2]|uniref:SapC family protein n=1 Tax=Catenovulum agarivorans DS-2 TaxID=1328313 RepID=W7QA28_9ALTE|nr:SapC family protein [Catenovulum agarivorans]EWH09649.1 SapC family protein [Catenovulum agarivorans DS-2]
MQTIETLDPIRHHDLTIETGHSEKFGENIHCVPVVANELNQLIPHYPVCLLKDTETGQFGLYALLGFEPNQNLYIKSGHWGQGYLPLHIQRQPFIYQPNNHSVGLNLAINVDNPRVNKQTGENLFDDNQQPSGYLKNMAKIVEFLHSSLASNQAFIQTLLDANLIDHNQLKFQQTDGQSKKIDGLYQVSQQKLSTLSDQDVVKLHQSGALQACYLLLASQENFKKLINWYND